MLCMYTLKLAVDQRTDQPTDIVRNRAAIAAKNGVCTLDMEKSKSRREKKIK